MTTLYGFNNFHIFNDLLKNPRQTKNSKDFLMSMLLNLYEKVSTRLGIKRQDFWEKSQRVVTSLKREGDSLNEEEIKQINKLKKK